MIDRTLLRLTLRQTLRSRKMLVALLVALVPVAVGALMIVSDIEQRDQAQYEAARGFAVRDHYSPIFLDLAAYLILGGTLPFMAILLVGGVVADELEDRTLSYILVRPFRRRTLLLSRLLPVAAVTAALGAAQVVLLWLMRMLSLAIVGQGAPSTVYRDGVATSTLPDAGVLGLQLPSALLVTVLVAAAFVALFGFVALLTPKYHFLANLGVATLIEATFGNLGGKGLGVFTVTYQSRSLLEALDPTGQNLVDAAAPGILAFLALLALTAIWAWAGTWRIGRQDFNITSAAS